MSIIKTLANFSKASEYIDEALSFLTGVYDYATNRKHGKTLSSFNIIPQDVEGMMSLLAEIHDYMWKGYNKELAILFLDYESDGRIEEIQADELKDLLKDCKSERKNARLGYLAMLKIERKRNRKAMVSKLLKNN